MKRRDILSSADHSSGMTVPEGYFDDFARKMTASLPEQPWEKAGDSDVSRHILTPTRTLWNTVRPYVYMAAMFAGIWCMMKMFDFMRPADSTTLGLEGNPRLTAAVSNPSYLNDYILNSSTEFDDMESSIFDDLYNEGFTPVSIMTEDEDYDTTANYN